METLLIRCMTSG